MDVVGKFSPCHGIRVMDIEGRAVENVIWLHERVRVLDARGVWREGVVESISGGGFVLGGRAGGLEDKRLAFRYIEKIERI